MTATFADESTPLPAQESPTPGMGRALQTLLIVAPAAVMAVVAWNHRFITDDGFIFFRIVNQILAGHGPVFNTGERVEAYTSPLWVALLTAFGAVTPFSLERIAVGLGIVGTAVGLGLACWGSARLVADPKRRSVLIPVGALVPLSIAPMWDFATSGLETGLVFCWEGACLAALAHWTRTTRRLSLWAAALLGLGWLLRPDLLVFSVAFAVAVLAAAWREDRWTDRGRTLLAMFALPLLYQLFRMGYFGAIVPNTAIAKEATLSRWAVGWQYLADFVTAYWLWLPVLALVVGAYIPLALQFRRAAATRSLAVGAAFLGGAVLQTVYVVRVGGDYFPARLLLPALFGICAPVAMLPWRRALAPGAIVVIWAIGCGIVVRPTGGLEGGSLREPISAAARGWGPGGAARGWFTTPSVYYSFHRVPVTPAPGLPLPTAALWGIGLPAYSLGNGLHVLDLLGLADPVTARLQLRSRGLAGHEKQLPGSWAAARLAAAGSPLVASDFPPSPLLAPMIPTTKGAAFDRQVAWARAAMRCPALVALRESYSAPLTPGRFVSNLLDSFDSTSLRIPADPKAAYRKFCGSGRPPGT